MRFGHKKSDFTGGFGNQLLLALQGCCISSKSAGNYSCSNNNLSTVWIDCNSKFDNLIDKKFDLSNTLFYLDNGILNQYLYNNESNNNTLSVHFRGKDFDKWKKHSIMSAEYYIEYLKLNKNRYGNINLFTDDPSHKTFIQILQYLSVNNINYTNYSHISKILSLYLMSSSEDIIASPSTFALSAALIGRKNIIFSINYAEIERGRSPFWENCFNKNSVIPIQLI